MLAFTPLVVTGGQRLSPHPPRTPVRQRLSPHPPRTPVRQRLSPHSPRTPVRACREKEGDIISTIPSSPKTFGNVCLPDEGKTDHVFSAFIWGHHDSAMTLYPVTRLVSKLPSYSAKGAISGIMTVCWT